MRSSSILAPDGKLKETRNHFLKCAKAQYAVEFLGEAQGAWCCDRAAQNVDYFWTSETALSVGTT